MESKVIQIDRRGALAWLRLSRPKALNALSPDLVADFERALSSLEADASVRVLAITGTGRAFCAGADLAFALDSVDAGDALLAFVERAAALVEHVAAFPKPVIAAVNGLALAGGLELVLACDLVIAAESARLGDAHANYGLLPGAGGSARLARRLGASRAKSLLFTGELVAAPALVELGLVNRVVPDAELEGSVEKLAETLAAKSPLVLRAMKRLVDDGLDQSLAGALRLEQLALRAHVRTADLREGLAAFREKRAPRFSGC
ncbi:MAG TPA: enoyl-CoA hydratase-related protein [Myxococcota bacterium]|nr:enoyl-CoA hydratase-related protein [Myxococcota bacterium]